MDVETAMKNKRLVTVDRKEHAIERIERFQSLEPGAYWRASKTVKTDESDTIRSATDWKRCSLAYNGIRTPP